jgi:D-alanine--poly(phosphoribitol) ligase subunit 1
MFTTDIYNNFRNKSNQHAFCINDEFFSYEELGQIVGGIIKILDDDYKDINKIALMCTDSIYTYGTILACWFTNRLYVPLSEFNPDVRNLNILRQAEIKLIIHSENFNVDKYTDFEIIKLTTNLISRSNMRFEFNVLENSLSYILFTSGSTGEPKGVQISMANLDSFVKNFSQTEFQIKENDRCLQMFELTFDVSISSFVPALIAGACVYTTSQKGIKYINVLKTIQKHDLTSIQIVPSIINLSRNLLSRLNFKSVRQCILTGEATNIKLLPVVFALMPNTRLYNYYGPTETTIYCSYTEIQLKEVQHYNGLMAIGREFPNMNLQVVDMDLSETVSGCKGELVVSGDQVTTGYLNNNQKNIDSFFIKNGTRFYKTGDVCFKDENGLIYYCGRQDSQVKIQGYRVEISEIEFNLSRLTDKQIIVIVDSDKNGNQELIAIGEKILKADFERINDELKLKVPPYMVPSNYFSLDSFPLTASGKIDKAKAIKLVKVLDDGKGTL